jgi:hypothetical protein
MTEHSPDQEPRLLEGSSADRRTVTLVVADARADAELAVDVAEVGVDRVMGKEEPGRGLAIRQAPATRSATLRSLSVRLVHPKAGRSPSEARSSGSDAPPSRRVLVPSASLHR